MFCKAERISTLMVYEISAFMMLYRTLAKLSRGIVENIREKQEREKLTIACFDRAIEGFVCNAIMC